MDNPGTCGQTLTIYENVIVLSARATVSLPNPPTSCAVTLNTGYTDSYYYIRIEQTAIMITDCAFVLNIFLGSTAGGQPLVSMEILFITCSYFWIEILLCHELIYGKAQRSILKG